ncbi:MAG: alpha/beta hydrolase [Actinomycetota bacterium]|nr:alpha/beta hydrolase [Actinomycetota bacterium]
MQLSSLRGPVTGGGPPLVLLHGFALDARVWTNQLKGLALRWPVVALDLRGFGASASAPDRQVPSMEVMADDVAATMERLSVGPAYVAGLSMGGYVAMAMLRRRPDLVVGLVLADTRHEADDDARRRERERLAKVVEEQRSVRVIIEEVAPRFTGTTTRSRRPDVQELVDAMVASTSWRAAAWALRAMATRPPSTEALRRFDGPALVVAGAEDVISPPSLAREMAASLPRGKFVEIADAGHLSPLESGTAFDRAVLDWIEQAHEEGSG